MKKKALNEKKKERITPTLTFDMAGVITINLKKNKITEPDIAILNDAAAANNNIKERNFLRGNIFAIIVSVLIAFVIHFYVMSIEVPAYTQTYTVPINILENDYGLAVYHGENNVVEISVQGKKSDVENLNKDEIAAYVDASHIKDPGKYPLDVYVTVPRTVKLQDQSVNTVIIHLDNRASTTVPVNIILVEYQIEEDYELPPASEFKSDRHEITITGPQAVLDTVAAAQVNLKLGNIKTSVTVAGTLELVDINGKRISNPEINMQPSFVKVEVPLLQYKTVPLDVEYAHGFYNKNSVDISISPAEIRIKGETGDIKNINKINLMPLDEKKITTNNLTVNITLPSGIENVDEVDKAVITITHKGTSLKQFVIDKITVYNPNNLNCELLEKSINVILRGNNQYINYIQVSDIEAIVDLSYIDNATGTASVPVLIKIKETYSGQVYEIGDYRIPVKIN